MFEGDYNYYKRTNDGLIKKIYGGKLEPCPLCGGSAIIAEWNGIGDIRCRFNDNGECPSIHYSGKWRISKSKAIKMWNNITR
jgi:hypothetical protein